VALSPIRSLEITPHPTTHRIYGDHACWDSSTGKQLCKENISVTHKFPASPPPPHCATWRILKKPPSSNRHRQLLPK
jgi:hypothetical protein